ncbi:MAG TPA: hypothetical protein PK185_08645 [Cyclobacteriaceae bacterium]|nr:hypothetical protein [Cyclobacteriaceae bacterium]HRK53970.1 hypothetical protein [Cyclobacteriaceae bacterium]
MLFNNCYTNGWVFYICWIIPVITRTRLLAGAEALDCEMERSNPTKRRLVFFAFGQRADDNFGLGITG